MSTWWEQAQVNCPPPGNTEPMMIESTSVQTP